jgi:hypothetical protein
MTGVVSLLQAWWAAAEQAALRAPTIAGRVAAGSWPAEALLALAGFALLVAGARLGRFLACAGGAGLGWLVGGLAVPYLHGWLPGWLPSRVGAAALGLASLLSPGLYPFALGLVPGVLLGLRVPIGGNAVAGGLAGGVSVALLALWVRRGIFAGTAACAGAALVSLVLLAVARDVPALLPLARRPVLLAALAAAMAVAGTAYQLGAGVEPKGKRSAETRKLENVQDR